MSYWGWWGMSHISPKGAHLRIFFQVFRLIFRIDGWGIHSLISAFIPKVTTGEDQGYIHRLVIVTWPCVRRWRLPCRIQGRHNSRCRRRLKKLWQRVTTIASRKVVYLSGRQQQRLPVVEEVVPGLLGMFPASGWVLGVLRFEAFTF